MDAAQARYILLRMDQLALLLPQQETASLEPRLDVRTDPEAAPAVGWIDYQENPWPVYCANDQLQLQNEIPPSYRVCVLLRQAQGYFGILCATLQTLSADDFQLQALPACMQNPASPLQAIGLYAEQLLCLSNSEQLLTTLTGTTQQEAQ